jgi:hypothetical protein
MQEALLILLFISFLVTVVSATPSEHYYRMDL